jgi:hypothetical protein
MRATIHRPLLLFLAAMLSTMQSLAQSSAQQQEQVFRKFEGTYVTGHEFGGSSLTLRAAGLFFGESASDDGTQVFTSGSYVFTEGRLHFRVLTQIGKRGSKGKKFNLLDPKENKHFYEDDSAEIEKQFELRPIEWSGRIYLLDEEDLKNFANAINLGIEPRARLTSSDYDSPWYGSFYLRTGDEQKQVRESPPLPPAWLDFLLSQPITATVISIEEKKESSASFIVTIDKGSRDGLKVGMRLVAKDEEPSPFFGTEVISIAENSSKIRTSLLLRSELKVGDKISSRYKPKDLYK